MITTFFFQNSNKISVTQLGMKSVKNDVIDKWTDIWGGHHSLLVARKDKLY